MGQMSYETSIYNAKKWNEITNSAQTDREMLTQAKVRINSFKIVVSNTL